MIAAVDAAIAGGADAVLLREKRLDSARLLSLASQLRELTRKASARLIIHTQADIALAVEADGVHVAQNDIGELPVIRRWLGSAGERMTLSASVHDAESLARAADAGADFILLSPVFPTASHPEEPALGIDAFKKLAGGSRVPVVALGGITPANREQLRGFGVAAIGSLLLTDDPGAAAAAMVET